MLLLLLFFGREERYKENVSRKDGIVIAAEMLLTHFHLA
jgi:hypothetical protein